MLSVDERPVGPLQLALIWPARAHGLLGRDGIDGALLLQPGRWVHTLGMRFPIDVAFCGRDRTVIATVRMERHRVGRPRLRAACVVEAEAGAFARWGLVAGSVLGWA